MGTFMQFTDHGIEGVVPLELLPPDVRSKYQAKPNDRSKRAKKEDAKGTSNLAEENQVLAYHLVLGLFLSRHEMDFGCH